MRRFLLMALIALALPVQADSYQQLFQSAGWPQQRAHFLAALQAAQQRYQSSLPPALYQSLVENSNRRFAAEAIDQRVLGSLRQQLPDSQPALGFFGSDNGRRVVQAEVEASRPEQLARNAQGLPAIQVSASRQALIERLAKALPASEAGAEVSLALASLAADSLSQMLPGLLGNTQSQELLDTQRQRLQQQIDRDLVPSLRYIYRELSDAQLQAFVGFAESAAGQAYYRAAIQAVRAGLDVAR